MGVVWSGGTGAGRDARRTGLITAGLLVASLLAVRTRHQQAMWQTTVDLYNHAISLAPRIPYLYINRGNAHNEQGDIDSAIRDYTKAIEIKPDYAEAYNNRSTAYNQKLYYDWAIRDCTRAIEIKPDYVKAYCNRGNAYDEKGDHHMAIRDYTIAINIKPDYVPAYHHRAVGFFRLMQYDQAWADVKRYRERGGVPDMEFVTQLVEASGRTEQPMSHTATSGK